MYYYYIFVADADGVRLGCYGHELYGHKYSTNYIADGKGE